MFNLTSIPALPGARPGGPALFQTPGATPQTTAVPEEDLEPVAVAVGEDKPVARERVCCRMVPSARTNPAAQRGDRAGNLNSVNAGTGGITGFRRTQRWSVESRNPWHRANSRCVRPDWENRQDHRAISAPLDRQRRGNTGEPFIPPTISGHWPRSFGREAAQPEQPW